MSREILLLVDALAREKNVARGRRQSKDFFW